MVFFYVNWDLMIPGQLWPGERPWARMPWQGAYLAFGAGGCTIRKNTVIIYQLYGNWYQRNLWAICYYPMMVFFNLQLRFSPCVIRTTTQFLILYFHLPCLPEFFHKLRQITRWYRRCNLAKAWLGSLTRKAKNMYRPLTSFNDLKKHMADVTT